MTRCSKTFDGYISLYVVLTYILCHHHDSFATKVKTQIFVTHLKNKIIVLC